MIERQLLKRIILEYQNVAKSIQYVPRYMGDMPAGGSVLVGLRRVGKSYMLYQIMSELANAGHPWESFLYLNMEDERLEQFSLADFDELKQCYEELFDSRPIFFLDEVQVIEGWEKFVRRVVDQKYTVYVTGSNAKMLSSELSSTLGGRLFEKYVYPFSFKEFLTLKGAQIQKHSEFTQEALLHKAAEEYLQYGGLAEVILSQEPLKRSIISNQFNAIFFRDLLIRHKIRGDRALRTMIRKMAESVLHPQSFARLAHVVSSSGQNIKQSTIASYVDYMIESLIIFPLENMAASISERTTIRKYYFSDNSFVKLFVANPNAHLLENLVALTLRKRFGDDLMYFNYNVEVDFVVPSQGLAVQATLEMLETSTFERECSALFKLAEWKNDVFYDLKIVTLSEERTVEYASHKIAIVPLWKWLLDNESLSQN